MRLAGRLASRVAIEPLDEERLTNIERRVVSGAADAAARGLRGPRRLAARLLVAGAIAAAMLVGWALRAPDRAVIAEAPPVRLETAAPAALDLGDARIASTGDTALVISRPAGGVLIAMARGTVELEVGKRGDRPPLIVRAGDTDVIVVGTRFSVDYHGGDVDVRVTEGVVRVVRQQQETRVAAGQAWRTRGGLVAAGDVPSGDHTVAVGPVPALLHDRIAAVPDPARRPAHAPPPAHGAPRPSEPRRPAPARPAARDLQLELRAQRVEPALDLGEPDAGKAIARYYDLAAHRSGDEASQAFYSIAVVRHLRLGQDVEALQVLDAYVRRFPGGKEYRAALWLRVRILCGGRLDDRCRAAAYTFVHEAPGDPAAALAERLTLAD